ncbi:hypothetical protein NE237_031396 [Protea cynaroides]|uniref:Uncharacterized protein n=1 Tax=Protea cynaroides TaxID=273540 RepID=A0A9Q0L260_9MAGN|nr:hypothetical protein NE237_031396 [Protea cynaroides]
MLIPALPTSRVLTTVILASRDSTSVIPATIVLVPTLSIPRVSHFDALRVPSVVHVEIDGRSGLPRDALLLHVNGVVDVMGFGDNQIDVSIPDLGVERVRTQYTGAISVDAMNGNNITGIRSGPLKHNGGNAMKCPFRKWRRWLAREKDKGFQSDVKHPLAPQVASDSGQSPASSVPVQPSMRRSFAEALNGFPNLNNLADLIVEGGITHVVIPQATYERQLKKYKLAIIGWVFTKGLLLKDISYILSEQWVNSNKFEKTYLGKGFYVSGSFH